MNYSKTLSNALFAGLATLSVGLSLTPIAEAKPVIIQRGPNGAAFIVNTNKVNSDKHSQGTQPLPVTSERETAKATRPTDKTAKESRTRRIITRGPNGAAFIVH